MLYVDGYMYVQVHTEGGSRTLKHPMEGFTNESSTLLAKEKCQIVNEPHMHLVIKHYEVPYLLDQMPLSISCHSRIVAAPLVSDPRRSVCTPYLR